MFKQSLEVFWHLTLWTCSAIWTQEEVEEYSLYPRVWNEGSAEETSACACAHRSAGATLRRMHQPFADRSVVVMFMECMRLSIVQLEERLHASDDNDPRDDPILADLVLSL